MRAAGAAPLGWAPATKTCPPPLAHAAPCACHSFTEKEISSDGRRYFAPASRLQLQCRALWHGTRQAHRTCLAPRPASSAHTLTAPVVSAQPTAASSRPERVADGERDADTDDDADTSIEQTAFAVEGNSHLRDAPPAVLDGLRVMEWPSLCQQASGAGLPGRARFAPSFLLRFHPHTACTINSRLQFRHASQLEIIDIRHGSTLPSYTHSSCVAPTGGVLLRHANGGRGVAGGAAAAGRVARGVGAAAAADSGGYSRQAQVRTLHNVTPYTLHVHMLCGLMLAFTC